MHVSYNPGFIKKIWVGKSPWTDCHIVLTPGGAVEPRTAKRLLDQFIGTDGDCKGPALELFGFRGAHE